MIGGVPMNKDNFTTISSKQRVQIVNDLLQKKETTYSLLQTRLE